MNIIISEHEVIVKALAFTLQSYDPDYPMDEATVIPEPVIKRLQSLLLFSSRVDPDEIDRFFESRSGDMLRQLKNDAFLAELLAMPFESIHVVDNQGTLVLTFLETSAP